ncbi:MAG: hypothetical protein QOI12_5233 [Alphaproteobacteria bacterium]|jgi:hypothetical protein|nr:hypothetical protein [Alphaproteobacteria bacterium]
MKDFLDELREFLSHPAVFTLLVLVGLLFPMSLLIRAPLVVYGMRGLIINEQIIEKQRDFEHEKSLREQDERAEDADFERFMKALEALKPPTS